MKTKYLIAVVMCLTLFIACKKDKEPVTTCGVDDPLNDLPWLHAMTNDCSSDAICQPVIMQGIYNHQPVFFNGLSGPLCDPAFFVNLRNCDGDIIKEYTWDEHVIFEQEVDSVKTIFSCWE